MRCPVSYIEKSNQYKIVHKSVFYIKPSIKPARTSLLTFQEFPFYFNQVKNGSNMYIFAFIPCNKYNLHACIEGPDVIVITPTEFQ